MNPADIAKELGRLATTHGLSKDVIDLMEKKISLLTDEIAALTKERDLYSAKVVVLEAEKEDLLAKVRTLEINQSAPAGRPDDFNSTTDAIVKMMFKRASDTSMQQIAAQLGLQMGIVQFHFDLLGREKMARLTRVGITSYNGSSPAAYQLTGVGRAYAVRLESGKRGMGESES